MELNVGGRVPSKYEKLSRGASVCFGLVCMAWHVHGVHSRILDEQVYNLKHLLCQRVILHTTLIKIYSSSTVVQYVRMAKTNILL